MPAEETDQVIGAYRAADQELRAGREKWRQEEIRLMSSRDAALRQMVGTQRGGVTRTARALGLSDAQILRLLDDGITRVARCALDAAGVDRSGYQLTHQRGGRSIGIVLVADHVLSEESAIRLLEDVGLRFTGRCPVSVSTTGELQWQELHRVKDLACAALSDAGISPRPYRLVARRGDRAVRLAFTSVVEGLTRSARERFIEVLRGAGLVVQDVEDDSAVLLISSPVDDSGEHQVQELLFSW